MPIIGMVADDTPLSQGDILRGIQLFSTGRSWESHNGEAVVKNDDMCLVVSRPCVLLHKDNITVVPIQACAGGVPRDVEGYDRVLMFLRNMRDGVDTPDQFYLGEIPGREGRFVAKLDSFHNMEIPVDDNDMAVFLHERRLARLTDDYRRDLHLRVFRVFAELGFDDVRWLSDDDLKWVVSAATSARAEAEKEVHDTAAKISRNEFAGQQTDKKTHKDLSKAEERLTRIESELAAYSGELERRTQL